MNRRLLGRLGAVLVGMWILHLGLYLGEPDLVMTIRSWRTRGATPPDPAFWGLSAEEPGDPAPGFRFVAVGHPRSLTADPDLLAALAARINRESPDLVLLLGDYTVDGGRREWAAIDAFVEAIEAPVLATPGNHEEARSWRVDPETARERFRERFGSGNALRVRPEGNLLLLDSTVEAEALIDSLTAYTARMDSTRPGVLLTHHRIWEAPPAERRWFHGRFDPATLLPRLVGRVGDVVVGDLPENLGQPEAYRPVVVSGMTMHPVGIGDRGRWHPIVYGAGVLRPDGSVAITVRALPVPASSTWYRVKLGDGHRAFRALTLGEKLRLYGLYLRKGKLPRGRVPVRNG